MSSCLSNLSWAFLFSCLYIFIIFITFDNLCMKWFHLHLNILGIMLAFQKLLCWWGLKYSDYILCKGVRPSPPPKWVSWVWHLTACGDEAPGLSSEVYGVPFHYDYHQPPPKWVSWVWHLTASGDEAPGLKLWGIWSTNMV